MDPPKRKLANHNGGVLREKVDNTSNKNVQEANGVKKRKQMVASVTSSVVSSSKKVPTIYKTGELVNGRYRIVQLLGTGSFGEVYRVADEQQRGQVCCNSRLIAFIFCITESNVLPLYRSWR